MRNRPRRAITGSALVEALVALTLLGVGVAAWAGTTALATRVAADSARANAAHMRARGRAELLAAGPCARLTDGSDGDERWQLVAGENGMRLLRVEVPYREVARDRVATYELAIAC